MKPPFIRPRSTIPTEPLDDSLASLRRRGKLDNTLIIYSSDHGSYRTDRNGGLKGNKGIELSKAVCVRLASSSGRMAFAAVGLRTHLQDPSIYCRRSVAWQVLIQPQGVHLDGADLSPLLIEKGDVSIAPNQCFGCAPSSGHLATLREGNYTLMGYRGYQLPFDRIRYNKIVRTDG